MHNVFFSMPALSLKLPIPILWVFFVLLFRLIFPIKEQKWLRHVLSYETFVDIPEISITIFPT